jgi:hypothetical protein
MIISGAAATPAVFLLKATEGGRLNVLQFLIPVIGAAVGALYLAIGGRDWLWNPEKKDNVRRQITEGFLKMIPPDLMLTYSERQRLAEAELTKELTGVFWEAIDGDPHLKEGKQFFYKNGLVYTSIIDAALLLPVFAFFYCLLGVSGAGTAYVFVGLLYFALTLIALFVGLPKCRAKHMLLSREQLDELSRSRADFVEARFRKIITEWRQPGR